MSDYATTKAPSMEKSMPGMSLVRPITWDEIVAGWREREEEKWRPHYTERGFKTWDEWRAQWTLPLKLAHRTWSLYRIDDPFTVVPKYLVGAYKGWRRYYPEGERVATFARIAEHPDLPKNGTVKSMLQDFPVPTTMIGLSHDGVVSIFDGTHRSATIAYAALVNKALPTDLFIALTEFGEDESDLFKRAHVQEP